MANGTGLKPEAQRRPRAGSLLHGDLPVVLVAGLVSALLCALLIRAPARVEQLTVHNPTVYELHVQVRPGPNEGWMPVAIVAPEATVAAPAVIDQGERWTFRVTGQGREGRTFELTRAQLQAAGWRVDVPTEVGDDLRAQGATPTPRTDPAAS